MAVPVRVGVPISGIPVANGRINDAGAANEMYGDGMYGERRRQGRGGFGPPPSFAPGAFNPHATSGGGATGGGGSYGRVGPAQVYDYNRHAGNQGGVAQATAPEMMIGGFAAPPMAFAVETPVEQQSRR